MNYLADESVDQQIVEHLRQDGHQVWTCMKSKISREDEINTCPRENGETIRKY
ncbi:MAG TPA: hypothetical protein ACFYD4_08350 [Candidatus Wunengus sp. YC61]|uniref:hypothetical protein n=1 Tax=Candidatus Wunengus sp. YC61 TaxID=3367698 RepID=UPI00402716D8